MKRETLLVLGLCVGGTLCVWSVFDFWKIQELLFHKTQMEKLSLEKEVRSLKSDLTFMSSNQKTVEFLKEKGWFFPQNRLIAGKSIENLRPLLKEMIYQFDPETVTSINDKGSFKVTPIFIEAESLLDMDMFSFIEKLLETFPGVLVPREVTLIRQKEGPPFMKGKFTFDWVSLSGERDEK